MTKIAIVTGASGNLGQAVVKKFIAEGYKVIGTIVPGDTTSFDFPAHHFEKAAVNLLDETGSKKFIESVITSHGSINVAVLTVGGFATGNITNTTTTDIMKQYRLNFETAYNIAHPVFIQMMQQGSGNIFMIGSKPGLDAKNGKGMIAYALGKSLVFRLAELMNDEAKGTNVVATVVVPGTIDTPPNRKAIPDANFSNWVTPQAIADVIFYHTTNEATALRESILKVYNNS
jgi:NAD(P)-dependent dehydrogenase (short-subunit alcohol dehydrogenase family)